MPPSTSWPVSSCSAYTRGRNLKNQLFFQADLIYIDIKEKKSYEFLYRNRSSPASRSKRAPKEYLFDFFTKYSTYSCPETSEQD
ncbi:unknown protein [Desulfotalea psychrophila LSv54]|uniref:Uncharacterized protein n=1 Tax=Desulfotalea psychrophila (strain LSv54 / DSM 12343) TaxID=177439 RepID=Q6AKB5_DESPS|nr:unknown protein [Desulfotalea psychrophila LSv54]